MVVHILLVWTVTALDMIRRANEEPPHIVYRVLVQHKAPTVTPKF